MDNGLESRSSFWRGIKNYGNWKLRMIIMLKVALFSFNFVVFVAIFMPFHLLEYFFAQSWEIFQQYCLQVIYVWIFVMVIFAYPFVLKNISEEELHYCNLNSNEFIRWSYLLSFPAVLFYWFPKWVIARRNLK
jgi:hypothetical protein